jgi:hypothetical protein
MLAASIKAEGLEAAVRIRNLSETGAMIEGAALPLPGTRLILRRLDVEIGARVIWHSAGRCGIQFEGAIAVEEWVGGTRAPSAPDLQGQARVDAIQAAIRSGTELPAERAPQGQIAHGPADLNARLANELAYVRRLLDSIGEELIRDPIMVQRHGQALQSFDIACQLLGHLGVVVGAADPQAAARQVTMDDLRSRLVGKPIF